MENIEFPSANGTTHPEDIGEPVTAPEIQQEIEPQPLSLIEQFKPSAPIEEVAVAPAPEEKPDRVLTIEERIIQYLQLEDVGGLWINITPLLKSLLSKDVTQGIIKDVIEKLWHSDKIMLSANIPALWGTPCGHDENNKTLYYSLENVNMYVKLFKP